MGRSGPEAIPPEPSIDANGEGGIAYVRGLTPDCFSATRALFGGLRSKKMNCGKDGRNFRGPRSVHP